MTEPITARHWIDGSWHSGGTRRDTYNPANGDLVGYYHDADAATARAAIDAARRCFDEGGWRHDGMGRATALSHLADAFQARSDEVIDTLTRENGKLRGEAAFEFSLLLRALRFSSGLAMQTFGRVLDPTAGQMSMVLRQPVGVAGLIIPWNGPAFLSIRALGPALAAGCTVALKLPGRAAQTAYVMSQIIESVPDIPPGAVNIFVETGSAGAELLVSSPDVPVISFTGSSAVGVLVARAAAANLKRVGLELGGKAPHVVFDDAELDAALPVLEKSATVFTGQFCMTGSRVIVQRGIAAEVRDRLARRYAELTVGPASDPASDMGPLIDTTEVARLDAAVEAAIEAGARPIVRGGPPTDDCLRGGAFYRPTLLEVDGEAPAEVRQEFFGPVQTFQVFDDEADAVRLANDTEYGLSSSVWTRDLDRAQRVAREIQAGLVAINSWASVTPEMEEGGWKHSGLGRLSGLAGLDDFLEYKQISHVFGSRP